MHTDFENKIFFLDYANKKKRDNVCAKNWQVLKMMLDQEIILDQEMILDQEIILDKEIVLDQEVLFFFLVFF